MLLAIEHALLTAGPAFPQGALFESNHFDENDVQTISHRCEVVAFKSYRRIVESDPKRIDSVYENNDLYYLAGEYDPIVGTIRFENGVFGDKDRA
jgi:hypothetical protein